MKNKQDILNQFGKKVRELRKQKGLSQEELAFRANLHRTYIGMIERAEKNITIVNIDKIAHGLDIDINQFFNDHKINYSNFTRGCFSCRC